MDWNLPKKDWHEVLKGTKENSNLKGIPVIILTTSSAEKDMARAYDLHTNTSITKPIDFDEFVKVIGSIVNVCLEAVAIHSKKD